MNGIPLQLISIVIFFTLLLVTSSVAPIITTIEELWLIFFLIIPYLLLHEFLHAIAYVINGANYKNITYGIHFEKGIMCCLCKQNISKKNILISLLFPFVLTGLVTYVIGFLINSPVLIWLSVLNMTGSSADLIMFFDLLRIKNFEYAEFDNPVAFGIYTTQDLSHKKLFGLKYIGKTNELLQKDLKKFYISRISVIIILMFLAFGLFGLFSYII